MIDIDGLTDIAIGSARGRKDKNVNMSVLRELNESDLALVLNPPEKGIEMKPLAKLRNTHHMLARLLAEGRSNGDCSLMTGYSPSRISILKNDPAFKELVHYYSTQAEAKYLDVHERLATLGMATLDELQERLESDPESFKNRELMELAEFALDRSVTKEQRKGTTAPPQISISFVGAPAPEGDLPKGVESSEGMRQSGSPLLRRPIEIDGNID